MPGTHRITCVQRGEGSQPYERITHVGGKTSDGTRWKISQRDAIVGIRGGVWAFHVSIDGEPVGVVIARGEAGEEYLKTEGDGVEPERLLQLPECGTGGEWRNDGRESADRKTDPDVDRKQTGGTQSSSEATDRNGT